MFARKALRAAVITAILLAGCDTTDEHTTSRGQAEETAVSEQFQYGFRYDPMEWVKNDESLQAVQVRKVIFNSPNPGDQEIVDAHVEKILANQQEDGSFRGDQREDGSFEDRTLGTVEHLLRMGCPPEMPQLRRAMDVVCRKDMATHNNLGADTIKFACLTGWSDGDEPAGSARRLVERCLAGPSRGGAGCPWTVGEAEYLYTARDVVDVSKALDAELAWIAERMNAVGSCSCKDPWAFVQLAGEIDHPVGRQIMLKAIPWILRAQHPDGSWGDGLPRGSTFYVLRALARYDLIEPLRQAPPLPADWRIIRAVPAPAPRLNTLAWDGKRLWTFCAEEQTAFAISPEDGTILKRLDFSTMPWPGKGAFLGWWDDCLGASVGDGIYKLNPDTGEVLQKLPVPEVMNEHNGFVQIGRQLWVADSFEWLAGVYDLEAETWGHVILAQVTGGGGTDMAWDGEGLWHFDQLSHIIVKSALNATPQPWTNDDDDPRPGLAAVDLLDYGEKLFAWCPPGQIGGITWDGQHLWIIDNGNQRIMMVEKSGATEWTPLASPGYIRDWLICGPFESELLPGEEQLRAGYDIDYLEPLGGEAAVAPADGMAVGRDGWPAQWRQTTFSRDSIMFAELFDQGNQDDQDGDEAEDEVRNNVFYAHTTFESPEARDGYLAMGVAGSLKVYFNGHLVHAEHLARYSRRETILIPVTFKKGANAVLVKVDNDIGSGGFILRPIVLDPVTLERVPLATTAAD
ncbi:MAG: hypothetical protein ACYS8X_01335 [Planctomycetota bacterium]|jgi:hypothetical protein